MKLSSQFAILLSVLLITTTEGLFFEYPKKVLSDFIHSLKAKKEAKKKPYENDIQHYHYHYYPVIYSLSDPPTKAPKKYELEKIHKIEADDARFRGKGTSSLVGSIIIDYYQSTPLFP